MAAAQSIRDALSQLFDVITEADAVASTCTHLLGEAPAEGTPVWPFVMSRNVDRIKEAADQLETLVRQKALPHLDDIEAANRSR